MIAAVIDFLRLKGKHTGGTGDHTKVTPLAPLFVYYYCALYFCHGENVLFVIKLMANIIKDLLQQHILTYT